MVKYETRTHPPVEDAARRFNGITNKFLPSSSTVLDFPMPEDWTMAEKSAYNLQL